MSIIENRYNLGQTVYLFTDKDQAEKIIIGILLRPDGIQYQVACGTIYSWHYELELSSEMNLAYKTS